MIELLESSTSRRDDAVEAKEVAFALKEASSVAVATSLLDKLGVSLAGEETVRQHKSNAIDAATEAVMRHNEGVRTVGNLIVPKTVTALLEEVRSCAPKGTSISEMTATKLVSA